jgi:hypothetical protein
MQAVGREKARKRGTGRVGGTGEVSEATGSACDVPARSGKLSDYSLHFFASSRSESGTSLYALCTVSNALLSLPLPIPPMARTYHHVPI